VLLGAKTVCGMRIELLNPLCKAEGTMAVKEEVKKRKRSHIARERVQAAWVSIIVLCSMLILGAVLLAFTDNYDWLLK
jgi:hypothetical protein